MLLRGIKKPRRTPIRRSKTTMKTSYSISSGRSTLPPFILELLAARPKTGDGLHRWFFRVARQLHAHLPAVEIIALLESRAQGCGRHVSRKEITDAVQNALACAWMPGSNAALVPAVSKWPGVNHEQRAAILRDNGGLADLWELSPLRIMDNDAHTEAIVDKLFPGNPLLCCGKSSSIFDTKPREAWRGELSALALIVPSPMSAVTGLTKDGRESKHTLANTGPRRFLICEFDKGTADEHAAILIHLAGFAPLVCVVHSGGKSCHGWFYVQGEPDAKVEKFFRYAVSLGADPATWTRVQFVRMPDGTRDNGKRQTIYFLNFKPLEAAL
jgi:hypothetical protein